MMVDVTLIKTTLRVLRNNADNPDLTEEIIGIDVQTSLRRPLAAHQLRDALMHCREHGWAVEEQDDFGLPTWRITPEGRKVLEKN